MKKLFFSAFLLSLISCSNTIDSRESEVHEHFVYNESSLLIKFEDGSVLEPDEKRVNDGTRFEFYSGWFSPEGHCWVIRDYEGIPSKQALD